MLRMTLNETLKNEYLKNPFLLCTLIILGLTTFNSAFIAYDAMYAIVVDNLYIPILAISLIISFFVSIYPIQKDLIDFGRKKGNKVTAIGFVALIYSLLYVNALYYMIEPYTIFAIFPGFVTDHKTFDSAINASHLIVFLALPLLSAFTFALIKNKLNKYKKTHESE